MNLQNPRIKALYTESERRILVLDGGMGTMIQRHDLSESDYRGTRFADWPHEVKGNNDLLILTQNDLIYDIHLAYYRAGADLVSTNSFNATTIAQADYGMEELAWELNKTAAETVRRAGDAATAEDGRPRWVVGAIGPTNRTASISPKVDDASFRNVTFDELRIAYREAIDGLMAGGADILLVETIFDTLNAKAALYAIDEIFEEKNTTLPIMISGTITDRSGRTLSGQTVEAFWTSLRHAKPFSIGLNCALGPDLLRPYLAELARIADTRISSHPNAGLPNGFGGYDLTPQDMCDDIREWAESGLLNIIGGCCGTTPDHIRAIAAAVTGIWPRQIPSLPPRLRLSGLEATIIPIAGERVQNF